VNRLSKLIVISSALGYAAVLVFGNNPVGISVFTAIMLPFSLYIMIIISKSTQSKIESSIINFSIIATIVMVPPLILDRIYSITILKDPSYYTLLYLVFIFVCLFLKYRSPRNP
jgi:hypothetical protein